MSVTVSARCATETTPMNVTAVSADLLLRLGNSYRVGDDEWGYGCAPGTNMCAA